MSPSFWKYLLPFATIIYTYPLISIILVNGTSTPSRLWKWTQASLPTNMPEYDHLCPAYDTLSNSIWLFTTQTAFQFSLDNRLFQDVYSNLTEHFPTKLLCYGQQSLSIQNLNATYIQFQSRLYKFDHFTQLFEGDYYDLPDRTAPCLASDVSQENILIISGAKDHSHGHFHLRNETLVFNIQNRIMTIANDSLSEDHVDAMCVTTPKGWTYILGGTSKSSIEKVFTGNSPSQLDLFINGTSNWNLSSTQLFTDSQHGTAIYEHFSN